MGFPKLHAASAYSEKRTESLLRQPFCQSLLPGKVYQQLWFLIPRKPPFPRLFSGIFTVNIRSQEANKAAVISAQPLVGFLPGLGAGC
jgi:hypothetical protein